MADLRRWTFATVHTGLLVVVALWLVHLAGALGDLLAGLNTALGLGAYAGLWLVVWLVTGRAFDETPPGSSPPRDRAKTGFLYGGLTGAGFLLVLVVSAFLVVLVGGGQLLPVLIVGVVGGVVSLLVGGAIGVAFALLDAPLVHLGEQLVPGDQ